MSKLSRLKTLTTIIKTGIIPVFYNPDINTAKKIAAACYKGGARAIEMTNRGDHAVELFSQLEKYCRKELPGIAVGAGSISDAPTAALFIAGGADFIVGPVLDEETAILCNKRKVPYSPGCGSATEIQRAHSLGVEIVKVFPGTQVGGPAFVNAIMGPCPWTSIMPTGGVDPTKESLTRWFEAGVVCVGMGSKLITKEAIEKGDFDKITRDTEMVISLIKNIRKTNA
jgi:2-dehydro-3-deoxyphosphogluconate aldolase / (4S)-4-hydroxy-2-oxoglutarate aldolase